MKSYLTKGNVSERRKGVVKRLKQQLVDGVKKAKVEQSNFAGIKKVKEVDVPLTEKDVTRIRTEIRTLESRF